MQLKEILKGVLVALLVLALFPLTASQTSGQASAAPAVFSDQIVENLVLHYEITEFETASGASTGKVAIGYDPNNLFWGYNLTLSVGDIIYIKIDTRDDTWEQQSSETDIIYSAWDYGVLGWGPECNVTLFPGGKQPADGNWTALEVDPVFSRMMIFPQAQLLVYPPQDGQDYSSYMVPMFGSYDDNGTIHPGTWTGSGYTLMCNVTYNPNATYYMYWDATGILQLQYLKIPATFSRDESGNLLAHWNYSYYDMAYTLFNSGYLRWTSWAYANGIWPLMPFAKVITNVDTGITQSVEFYFGEDSAWKNAAIWGAEHPFLTQCGKLKLELKEIQTTLSFEVAFIFVGLCITAIAVFLSRRQK
ncbi:MAG: hypothetical protein ACFFBD_19865 [Candidatus Hodarchaeota archaeon]